MRENICRNRQLISGVEIEPLFPTDLLSKAGAVASAIALTASAAAASDLFKRFLSSRSTEPVQITLYDEKSDTSPPTRFQIAKRQVLHRLKEAQALQEKKQTSATASIWSARSLTIGQYVIGGVLASSFIQQHIPSTIVGVLGVLVLLASLISQRFHPEVTAQIAMQKAAQLEVMIRQSEDRIVVIETTQGDGDDPQKMLELLEKASRELNAITLDNSDAPKGDSSQPKTNSASS